MKILVTIMAMFLLACSSKKELKGPKKTVIRFFHCMDHHDIQCLWDMSGPKTHKLFTDLAKRMTTAKKIVNHQIPETYRKRYTKALLLDKLPTQVSPMNILATILNVKDMHAPSISPDEIMIQSLGKNYTAYVPGDATLLLVAGKEGLKLEILGNTFTGLPVYNTLIHNLDVLDQDIKLFQKVSAGSKG